MNDFDMIQNYTHLNNNNILLDIEEKINNIIKKIGKK